MLVGGRPRRRRAPRARLAGHLAAVAVAGGSLVASTAEPVGAAGSTFVVTSTGDQPDASSGDGVCRISGSSACTLRAALQQANASGGHDRIEFAIPGSGTHRIEPATAYPILTDPAGVTIDGYTQPGSQPNGAAHGSDATIRIEVRGTGPNGLDGLYLQSPNNVVRGLAVFDFQRTIRLWGSGAHHNVIVGNFIGTNAAGTFGQTARTINSTGVQLERGAHDNEIGRADRADRNVISGNGDRGVGMFDAGTDRNLVRNNVIGLAPDGSRLRNWGHGIDINDNASDNVVGGPSSGHRNVISGNELSGVEISHQRSGGTMTGNDVIGNDIGTDITGRQGTSEHRNREFGVNLEGKASCPTVASCSPDLSDSLVAANTIVGSAAGVMIWKGAHDNVVRGNRIGMLPDGSIAPSATNTIWGVLIEAGAFDNLVETNTIRGGGDGIQVRPDNDYTNLSQNPDIPTFGNTFRRNSIDAVSGFGIDIAPIGAINDEPGELDADLQGAIVRPTISSASEDRVVVSTCSGCLVELFIAPQPGSAAYVPGTTFVVDGSASSAGTATFTNPAVDAGDRITATTTDGDGNTSEFAARRTVSAGSGGGAPELQPAVRCGTRC